jgi:prevent-host-death family protein
MAKTYSLYEAKARLSAIIRQVRDGQRVTVTVHGEPVAEIRPLATDRTDLAARLEALADRGILVRPVATVKSASVAARRPGALARFLAERDS